MSGALEGGLRLRPMHPEHLAQVRAIESRAYEFPWSENVMRDCLKVGYSSWVLGNGLGEVLGYAFMSLAVGEAHILNITIAPEQQRRGLGRQLMTHLLGVAREAGTTEMLLEVRRSNRAALALYRGFGFENIGLRKGYYPAKDGREDAFVLSRQLE